MAKSMVDIAYDTLKANGSSIPFVTLWQQVAKESGLSESQANNKIAQFYTRITTDARFIQLEKNCWDIRSRHKFDELKKSIDIIDDDEEEVEIEE